MRKSQWTHNTKLKTQRHIIGHRKNDEQHGPQQNIGGELRCSRRLSSFYLLYVMFCDSLSILVHQNLQNILQACIKTHVHHLFLLECQ
jgi:hypothetical protein